MTKTQRNLSELRAECHREGYVLAHEADRANSRPGAVAPDEGS